MPKAHICLRSGRHCKDHDVDLERPASEYNTSDTLEIEIDGRKRTVNVEIAAPGTNERPLYVA